MNKTDHCAEILDGILGPNNHALELGDIWCSAYLFFWYKERGVSISKENSYQQVSQRLVHSELMNTLWDIFLKKMSPDLFIVDSRIT